LVEKLSEDGSEYCLGIVHNRDDAEDLAQDVFLEVFRSSGNFGVIREFQPGCTGLQLIVR
jgi:DNA-directed RNA polymerase specialized sigma24 family protein